MPVKTVGHVSDAVRGQQLSVRILSQTEGDVYSVYLYVRGTENSMNVQLVQRDYATVIAGCQLDIDLDLVTCDNAELGTTMLHLLCLYALNLGSDQIYGHN